MVSQGVTPLPICPPGRLFVPECLRSEVLQWGHCSRVDPGVNLIMFLVKQRFWRPGMVRDIHLFVLACSVSKSSHLYLYSALNNTNCNKATAQYQNSVSIT